MTSIQEAANNILSMGIVDDNMVPPLVTNLDQLFFHFPYERLAASSIHPLVSFFLRPEVVMASILFYVLSERVVEFLRDTILKPYFGFHPKSQFFVGFVAVHNLALTIYSAVSSYYTLRAVIRHYISNGFMAVYCDVDGSFWHVGGAGLWSTIFYLSKYWEFVDTWILVLKDKKVSLLQIYHHTGIVLCLYGGVVSQGAWVPVFCVTLNCIIHTIMYFYFFMKTIQPTMEIKSAKYLTMAQIGQFFIGIFTTLGIFAMGEKCDTISSRFSLACLHIYGIPLIALFFSFARKKYAKKKR